MQYGVFCPEIQDNTNSLADVDNAYAIFHWPAFIDRSHHQAEKWFYIFDCGKSSNAQFWRQSGFTFHGNPFLAILNNDVDFCSMAGSVKKEIVLRKRRGKIYQNQRLPGRS